MTDDGGVLGNLPRSRPGQRSEKRTAAKAAPAAGAAKAAPAGGAAKRPKSAARTAGAKSAPRNGAPASQSRDAQPAAHAGDPVGDAIRTVTGVAATGARVAGGVAREVIRRLPRP